VRDRGIDWVPEPRGHDDRGREVVGHLPGEVPAYPLPAWVWADGVLTTAAAMLRRLHDATAGFERADAHWRLPAHEPAEVVCHNDFAPYNLVFRDRVPVGVIDFDTASPGPRVWDLAYLAYRAVPLTAPANPDAPATPEAERDRRLALLCGAYGARPAPEDVLAALPARLDELRAFTLERGLDGDAALYAADARYARERRG
jgi:aminoglycoside phosphotransferase (APT) family kinase protein